MPGKVVGQVTEKHLAMIAAACLSYRRRWPQFKQGLRAIE